MAKVDHNAVQVLLADDRQSFSARSHHDRLDVGSSQLRLPADSPGVILRDDQQFPPAPLE